MTDFDRDDDQASVFDPIDNPVVALSNAVLFLPREFLASGRARIIGQILGLSKYSLGVFLWNRFKAFIKRLGVKNAIFCHPPSAFSAALHKSLRDHFDVLRTLADPLHLR